MSISFTTPFTGNVTVKNTNPDIDMFQFISTSSSSSITYDSSSTSRADFNGSVLNIKDTSTGNTTITATQGSRDDSFTLTNSSSSSILNWSTYVAGLTKTFGDSTSTLTAPSNTSGTVTYTSSDTSVATINSSRLLTVIGAGSCVIIASQVRSGVTEISSFNLTVDAINISATQVNPLSQGYTGSSRSAAVLSNVSPANATFSGSLTASGTNAGTYTSSITGTGNYRGTVQGGNFVITKAQPTVTWNYSTQTKTYSSSTQSFNLNLATSSNSGTITYSSDNTYVAVTQLISSSVKVTYSNSTVYKGDCNLIATQAETSNYFSASDSIVLIVNQATITADELNPSTSYNGSSQTKAVLKDVGPSGITNSNQSGYSGSLNATGTNAGSYDSTITGTGNYKGTVTGTLTITSNDPDLNFNNDSKSVKYGDPKFTYTATSKSSGAITYSSNNTSVATVNSTSGEVTIVNSNNVGGSCTITASQAQDSNGNYKTDTASYKLYVDRANLTGTSQNINLTYNGSSQSAILEKNINGTYTSSYDDDDDDINYPPGDFSISKTNAGLYGPYTLTGYGNFKGTLTTGQLSIVQANLTGTATDDSADYDGTSKQGLVITDINGTYNGSPYASGTNVLDGGYTTSITGTGNYKGTVYGGTFTINPAELTGTAVDVNKYYNGSSQSGTIETGINGTFSYNGNNYSPGDFTINQTAVGTYGPYTLTGYDNYTGSLTTGTFTIESNDPDLQFDSSSITRTYEDNAFIYTASSNSSGAITYSSSNEDVATIKSTTGLVTIVGAGSCDFTASQVASGNYADDTATVTLTVDKAVPDISWPNPLPQGASPSVNDNTIQLNAPTSENTKPFTYESSDTEVATVDDNGLLTVISSGTVKITASQIEDDNYLQDSIDTTIKIVGFPDRPGVWVDPITVTYGDNNNEYQLNEPWTTSSGSITYTSSDETIATVDNTGLVKVIKVGTTSITVTQAATEDYAEVSIDTTFNVLPADSNLNWGDAYPDGSITKTYGDDNFTLSVPSSNSSGAITYSSSNEDVATVDSNSGEVTIVNSNHVGGDCTLKASQEADGNYAAGFVEIQLIVNCAQLTGDSSDVTKEYTGSEYTETVIDNVVGTYSGSTSISATDAGVYGPNILTGTDNYFGSSLTTGILTIDQAPLTGTAVDDYAIYDGTKQTALVITDINGTYDGDENASGINVGIYTTSISGNGNYTGTVNGGNFEINPAQLTGTPQTNTTTFTYIDGVEQSFDVEIDINGTYSAYDICGNLLEDNLEGNFTVTETDAGTYGPYTLVGSGNYGGDSLTTGTFTIEPADPQLLPNTVALNLAGIGTTTRALVDPDGDNNNLEQPVLQSFIVWLGDGQLTFESSRPDIVTISADGVLTFTGVTGRVTITVTLAPTQNYLGASITFDINIQSRGDPMRTLGWLDSYTVPYNPDPENYAFKLYDPWTTTPGLITYSSSDHSIATVNRRGFVKTHNAGTCILTVTQEGVLGYDEISIDTTLTVTPLQISGTFENVNLVYNGDTQTGTVITSVLPEGATYDGSLNVSGNNAGQYSTYITGTGNYTGTFYGGILTINPIQLNGTPQSNTTTYTGSDLSFNVETGINGTYTVLGDISNTIHSGNFTVTGKNAGTYGPYTLVGSGNYGGVIQTGVFNISPIVITGTTVDVSANYNGANQTATIITNILPVGATIIGSTDVTGKLPGNYTTYIIGTGNYTGVVLSGVFTINPTSALSNICFRKGTPIRTDQGLIHIDKIDTDVHTIRTKKIVAITKTVTQDNYLVCFEKDSIAPNMPSEKTVISSNHLILNKGKMIRAKDFIGKFENVYKVKYTGEVLYNVLMEEYDRIVVNNLICESLHPENTIAQLYKILPNLTQEQQEEVIQKFNQFTLENNIFKSSSQGKKNKK